MEVAAGILHAIAMYRRRALRNGDGLGDSLAASAVDNLLPSQVERGPKRRHRRIGVSVVDGKRARRERRQQEDADDGAELESGQTRHTQPPHRG